MRWFKWMQHLIAGHPGVYREWEWRPAAGQWRERDDAWTCIRCACEIVHPAPKIPTYCVSRPYMESRLIDLINQCVDEHGADRLRVRGGDPATR